MSSVLHVRIPNQSPSPVNFDPQNIVFTTEAYFLLGILVYVAVAVYGAMTNNKKITKWHVILAPPFAPALTTLLQTRFSSHRHIFEQQFSKPLGRSDLVRDGHSDAYNFSTGRRNVTSLHTVFTLKPRHDLIQWLYHFAWTFVDLHYRPKDDVTLDFKLAPNALNQDFVWGVVARDELRTIKQDRWDLVRGIDFFYRKKHIGNHA